MARPFPDAVDEFRGVALGDLRLDRRLAGIVGALQARPADSFPDAMGTDAATEGLYRFLENERVSWFSLLAGHVTHTVERASKFKRVFALHDSTIAQFNGEDVREGLFKTTRGRCGFIAHTCLAVAGDGTRRPLGLLGMIPVVRQVKGVMPEPGPGKVYEDEGERWLDLVCRVQEESPPETEIVHVMDREGDAWPLFDLFQSLEAKFVVRVAQDRRITPEPEPLLLSDHLPYAKYHFTRTVLVSVRPDGDRPPANKRKNPSRDERMAELEVLALTTQFARPDKRKTGPAVIRINVVHVAEKNPPDGEIGVSWVLATSLPTDTAEQVAAVVDAYRARWLIEEYFKALKTGCSYEDRQLESLDTLLVAFSLLAPIAWRLLALRWLGRNDADRPASELFSANQLVLLRKLDNVRRERLQPKPTMNQAMFAIARLGGFLQQNKVPGWQVIGRGLTRFLEMYAGYSLARRSRDEDAEM